MPLDQREKELAAIGASIGANCGPCIEHHLAAARESGLSAMEISDAVATARSVRYDAISLLDARVGAMLGHQVEPGPGVEAAPTSQAAELVSLGASVGANAHRLLQTHIGAAFAAGLELHQIRSALKMAGYVQQHAAALTADEVTRALTAQQGDAASETPLQKGVRT